MIESDEDDEKEHPAPSSSGKVNRFLPLILQFLNRLFQSSSSALALAVQCRGCGKVFKNAFGRPSHESCCKKFQELKKL